MSRKSCCRRPFDKQHGKRSERLFKSARHHLYHIYWSAWRKLNRKKSLSVICKILWLFFNSMSAHGKYFLLHRDKLRQPIWMYLSKKQKTCLIFATFFKFTSNFKHFEGKDDPDILCISRITDCKKCYINVLKVTLQNTFRQATW